MKKIALFLCLLMLFSSAQAAVSVRMEDSSALLNENGTEIVPAGVYADIVFLGENLFAAGDGENYALLDESGAALSEMIYSDFHFAEDMLIARRNGMCGLLNPNGSEICAFDYTRIIPNERGGFWALKGDPNDAESDEIFILSTDGGEKASGLYARALGEASDGYMPVQLSGSSLWGYCDADGRMAIPARYSHAGKFISGCAAVVQNGKYGAIDREGNVLVQPEYDALEISASGFILAAKNLQGAYVLDTRGGKIAAYEGEEVHVMLLGEGYGVVSGGELRIFNAVGVQTHSLDWEASVSEGLNGQLIVSEGSWGEESVYLLDTEKKYQNLYPLGSYENLSLYACMQVYAARFVSDLLGEIQYAVDMEMARYGVVNCDGDLLIPCTYETIEYLDNGRLLLHADGLWQMCDVRGEILWEYGTKQTEGPSSEAGF